MMHTALAPHARADHVAVSLVAGKCHHEDAHSHEKGMQGMTLRLCPCKPSTLTSCKGHTQCILLVEAFNLFFLARSDGASRTFGQPPQRNEKGLHCNMGTLLRFS